MIYVQVLFDSNPDLDIYFGINKTSAFTNELHEAH